jgi:hypothetical protein
VTDAPASFPVELDPPPPPPRRRHRAVTAPSGFLLFVCLFLPAIRVCGEQDYAYEYWPLATPYVLGLLVGILALVPHHRARRGLIVAIRALLIVTVVGWVVVLGIQAVAEGTAWVQLLVWVAVSSVLVALFGLRGSNERAATRVALATAILGIVWFGLWCLDPDALFGIYTAAGASLGLLVGALEWRREVARDATSPVVPRARVT